MKYKILYYQHKKRKKKQT